MAALTLNYHLNNRTNEFKSIIIKLDPKLILKNSSKSSSSAAHAPASTSSSSSASSNSHPNLPTSPHKISSEIIKSLKLNLLPNISKLYENLQENENEYVHNMSLFERSNYLSMVNSILKTSIKSINELETSLKINFQKNNYLKTYATHVQHYTRIFNLAKAYLNSVKNYWNKIQNRHQNNKIMVNKAKKLADYNQILKFQNRMSSSRSLGSVGTAVGNIGGEMEHSTPSKNSAISKFQSTVSGAVGVVGGQLGAATDVLASNLGINPVSEENSDPMESSGIRRRNVANTDDFHSDLENSSHQDHNPYANEQNQMLQEFSSLKTEVDQIGQTVTDIAKLQEELTEQVLFQGETIDQIEQNVEDATENVQKGNEELRNAIQNSAATRAALIFFLFMSSFLLLVLDWYSDYVIS